MRLTIVDWQMRLVNQIVENFDVDGLSDFLAPYLHSGYRWFVTPAGSMPDAFPHDRHGMEQR